MAKRLFNQPKDENKNYITPVGFEKLRSEYHELLNGERPKVVETVTWAASNGDRSENADYQYGKKRLREIDRRLHYLQTKIESSEVINPADIKSGRISWKSPVARALLGKKVDDEVKIIKPTGEELVTVINITYEGV